MNSEQQENKQEHKDNSNLMRSVMVVVLIFGVVAVLFLLKINGCQRVQEPDKLKDQPLMRKKFNEGLEAAIEALKSNDPVLVQEASLRIRGAIASFDNETVGRRLEELFAHDEWRIQLAIRIMGDIKYKGAEDRVKKMMEHVNPNIRAAVSYYYASMNDKSAMPLIAKKFDASKDLYEKIWHAGALARLSGDAMGKYALFLRDTAMSASADIKPGLRKEAVAAMAFTRLIDMLYRLKDVIYNYNLDINVRDIAILELSYFSSFEAMRLIFEIIDNNHPRQKLPDTLVGTAVRALLLMLDDDDPKTKDVIAHAYRKCKRLYPHVVEKMMRMKPEDSSLGGSGDWQADWEINSGKLARELEEYDDPFGLARSQNTLLKARVLALEDGTAWKKVDALIKSKSASLRWAGARLTAELPQKDAYKQALSLLNDENETVRFHAIRALGKFLPEHSREPLMKLWREEKNPRLRSAVAASLARIENDFKVYLDFLIRVLDAKDMASLAPEKKEYAPSLIDRLRVEAVLGIGHTSKKEAVPILKKVIMGRAYPRFVRRAAIVALGSVVQKESAVLLLEIVKNLDLPQKFPQLAYETILFGFGGSGSEIFDDACRENPSGEAAYKRFYESDTDKGRVE